MKNHWHLSSFLLVVALLVCNGAMSQQFKVSTNNYEALTFSLSTPMPQVSDVVYDDNVFSHISLPNCGPSTEVGKPQLPVFVRMVEVPMGADLSVEIESVDSVVVPLSILGGSRPLNPAQPHYNKSDTASHVMVIDNDTYSDDAFWRMPMVTTNVIGVARSQRVARLAISPVAYNPVTNQLVVYTAINARIKYIHADRDATYRLHRHQSSLYIPMAQVALSDEKERKVLPINNAVRYVIISPTSYLNVLTPFVEHQRKRGFIVNLLSTSQVGMTSDAIASYLQQQYDYASDEMPAPTFVLLVGDVAQLPTFRSRVESSSVGNSHVTDLYYTTWTDGDYLPDAYVGRFSGERISEISPQVEKSILYENYAFEDASYLSRAALIAGVDGGNEGDFGYNFCDPSMDYIAQRYVTNGNGYNTIKYFKNKVSNRPPGVTVTGSSRAQSCANDLRLYYNSGVGLVNYSAHGTERGWVNPEFRTNHVSMMTNEGMPSVIIGNCCLTGRFNTTQCFAESLLRRGDNAGAAVYIGASDYSYWEEDFYWSIGYRDVISANMHVDGDHYDANHLGMYDCLFHLSGEEFSRWAPTIGAMNFAGNAAVQQEDYREYPLLYWEMYTIFGDPSLMPWLGQPTLLTLDYAQPVSRVNGSLAVTTEPHAYIALSTLTDSIISTAVADADGNAVLSFDVDIPDSVLRISGIAQNRIPTSGTVSLTYDGNVVVGVSAVTAHNAYAGDTATFSFRVTNLGIDTLHYVNYVMRGLPSQLTPLHEREYIHSIAPRESVTQNRTCSTFINPFIADQTELRASLQFISGDIISNSYVHFIVNAPKLAIASSYTPNVMSPGDTIDVFVSLCNQGHDDAHNVVATLSQPYQLARSNDTCRVALIERNGQSLLHFVVALDSNSGVLRRLPFEVSYQGDNCRGRISFALPFFDDQFETGDFSTLAWQNGNDYPWIVTNTVSHYGQYSARSAYNLPPGGRSTMSLPFVSLNEYDTIHFDYRVSCETPGDEFRFYIDDSLALAHSDTANVWHHATIAVRAGVHEAVFMYKKDYSFNVDSDCVWIDGLILPDTSAVHSVFLFDTVCVNTPYVFDTFAVNTSETGSYTYSHLSSDTLYNLIITVIPYPEVRIFYTDTVALPGQTLMLEAQGAASYRWSTGDSTSTISVTPTDVTTYTVVGTVNQCQSSDSITIFKGELGISMTPTHDVSLYPNPTRGIITLTTEGNPTVHIIDVYGRVLQRHQHIANHYVLNLESIPRGLYLLRFYWQSHFSEVKIVKQ